MTVTNYKLLLSFKPLRPSSTCQSLNYFILSVSIHLNTQDHTAHCLDITKQLRVYTSVLFSTI